jgi:hypothetical protein
MDVNDDGGWLDERGVSTFFASKLAPTRGLIAGIKKRPAKAVFLFTAMA